MKYEEIIESNPFYKIALIFRQPLRLPNIDMHITPHMFCHSFATLLLQAEVDIRYIQKMLKHSSITTTEIYTSVSMSKQREILKVKHPIPSIHFQRIIILLHRKRNLFIPLFFQNLHIFHIILVLIPKPAYSLYKKYQIVVSCHLYCIFIKYENQNIFCPPSHNHPFHILFHCPMTSLSYMPPMLMLHKNHTLPGP